MAGRRKPQLWFRAQPAAIGGLAGLAVGIALRLPSLGVYLAAYAAAYAFPRQEEVSYGTPNWDRALYGHAYRKHLQQPFGYKLLFGPSGHASRQEGGLTPALRLSSWAGLLAAAVWAVLWGYLSTLLPWPEAIPTAGVVALEFALFFVTWQALAAGAREASYPRDDDSWPAALFDAENRERLDGLLDIPSLKVGASISAVLTGTAAFLVLWRVGSGLSADGTPWMFVGVLTGIGAVAGGVGVPLRAYIAQFNAELAEHLADAEKWQNRWLIVQKATKVEPPAFMQEHVQPPDDKAGDETHRIAFFQVAPGAKIEDYRKATDELRTAIGLEEGESEHVVVYPMPKTGPDGRPIPGSRQESAFAVAYNTAPLPMRPHLATNLDNWTTAYSIRQAFDRAFEALKLGTPDLVRVQPLHRRNTDDPLFETIWTLPTGLTYEKLSDKDRAIAEKLGADWCRVGRRTTTSASGSVRADHTVSVVFGTHPSQVTLSKPHRDEAWLEALDLEAAFRALRLGSPLLVDAYELNQRDKPRLLEARLRLSDDIDWGKVVKKTASLADKIEVPYLRVTRRRNDRGELEPDVSVIYGARPDDTVLLDDPPGFDPTNIEPGVQPTGDRLFLDAIDWDSYYRECKLVGSDGTSPQIVGKHVNEHGVETFKMRHVAGLDIDAIRKGIGALKSSSKRSYIEVVEEIPKSLRSDGENAAAYFAMLTAAVDPLEKPYPVMDYVDEPKPEDPYSRNVFHDPVRGKPDIDWVVGPGADGQLLIDRWEGDNPHLLISGGCLTPDTTVEVMGESDPVHLGDLDRIDERATVRTMFPGGYGFGWTGASRAVMTRTSDIYRMRLSDGRTVAGTPDHPFYSQSRGWVGMTDLRRNERVATSDPNEPKRRLWTPIDDIRHIDYGQVWDTSIATTHNYLVNNGIATHNSGSGKALAVNTLIPTPDGWRKVGDLREGDRVYDEHGRPCTITWVSPTWEDRPTFDIEFDDGTIITADANHEWVVLPPAARRADYRERDERINVAARRAAAALRDMKDDTGVTVTVPELAAELKGDHSEAAVRAVSKTVTSTTEQRTVRYGGGTRPRTFTVWDRNELLEALAASIDVVATTDRSVTVTTEEMAAVGPTTPHGHPNWAIPVAPPVQREHADLPLDPYLLGLLLGDGGMSLSDRQTFTTDDPDFADHVRHVLPDGLDLVNDSPQHYRVVWPGRRDTHNDVGAWVADLGIDPNRWVPTRTFDPLLVLAGACAVSPASRPGPVTTSRSAAVALADAASVAGVGGCVSTYTGRNGEMRYEIPVDRSFLPSADPAVADVAMGAVLAGVRRDLAHGTFHPNKATANLLTGHLPAKVRVSWHDGHPTVLTCDTPKPPNPLKDVLTRLGVYGSISADKHVPDEYLLASAEQRLEVLRGLCDTDGSITEDGQVEFSSTSEQLAHDVLDLARSLGIKATISVGDAKLDGRVVGRRWRVFWTSTTNVFRLGRKVERVPDTVDPRVTRRYVRSVTPAGHAATVCIEVDSPTHQFLAGDAYVATHNSVATMLMLLQLIHNNHPDDLQVAMADPKTELVFFEDAPHVNHSIGLKTPGFGENPYRALADLLGAMRAEVNRRNTMFVNHYKKPQKLGAARIIAEEEIDHARAGTKPRDWPEGAGFPWWDGEPEDHPFMLPWQLIVIEECSTFFKSPAIKEQRPDWEEVIGHVEELARIARSAGFHIAFMTQYPKRENVPTTLLAQARRVGLMVPNRVASQLIIDEPGLEEIDTPGKGKMTQGKDYAGMRVLFVAEKESGSDEDADREILYKRALAYTGAIPGAMAAASMGGTDTGGVQVGTGPSVVSVPPPDPSGLWAAPGAGSFPAPAPTPPAATRAAPQRNGTPQPAPPAAPVPQQQTPAAQQPAPPAAPAARPPSGNGSTPGPHATPLPNQTAGNGAGSNTSGDSEWDPAPRAGMPTETSEATPADHEAETADDGDIPALEDLLEGL